MRWIRPAACGAAVAGLVWTVSSIGAPANAATAAAPAAGTPMSCTMSMSESTITGIGTGGSFGATGTCTDLTTLTTFSGYLYDDGIPPEVGCPPLVAFFTLILPSVSSGYDMTWAETSGAATNQLAEPLDPTLATPHPDAIVGPLQAWNGGAPGGATLGAATAAVTETCGFSPPGTPEYETSDSGPMVLTFTAPAPRPVT